MEQRRCPRDEERSTNLPVVDDDERPLRDLASTWWWEGNVDGLHDEAPVIETGFDGHEGEGGEAEAATEAIDAVR